MSAPPQVAQRQESQLLAILDAAPDAMIIVDRQGLITFLNAQTEALFGWQRDELLGQPVEVLVPERFRERHAGHRAHYHAAPRTRVAGAGVGLFGLRKDGSEFPADIALSPVQVEGGVLVIAAVRDMSEQRRQKDLYEGLLNAQSELGDGVAITEGVKFVHVNDALCKLYGYSREELLALPSMMDLIVPEERATLEARLRERLAGTQRTERGEATIARKDGQRLSIEYALKFVRSGERLQIFSIIRDITERKREEQERLAHAERAKEVGHLKELLRFKTQFMNTAAHELNTPLTPVGLQLEVLRNSLGNLTPEQRKSLDILQRSHERLSRLTQDLLDAGRLEAGTLGLRRQLLDLDAAAREAVESYAEAARLAGVALHLKVSKGARLDADRQRVGQVMTNLLDNALKFTPRGGSVTVTVTATNESGVVRVEDFGLGLTQDAMRKLFQPFSQVHDTMSMSKPGTGLGLYICRGIVELHGGRMWVESEGPSKGAAFIVHLPLRKEP